ncbi:thioredoxin-like protein [Neohortaea acidophila]|uniref:Thioredoxin-like protein n=1 Tax=Neohortaea acidophila TaxID=245834 RepID=A0A6A6PR74_9PEZI|nr:thioredoxin-like protein [Neohortaea acidophila]KAF2482610.1 thioredoxin-like protein [Neohortaea acidophila]
MALNPRFAGQKLVPSGSGKTLHTLEFFLDYVCPFSAKQFKTLYEIIPLVKQKYPDKVQFIFRQQIQPWHPSSTLVHEAGAAVLRTNPDKFWDFSERLFEKQTDFFDVNVVNEARNKTYERLAKIAGDVGVDSKKVYQLLEVPDKPDKDGNTNIGNGVTDDIKIMTKTNRLVGVHVTPTVMFNGVVEGGISSSFTKEDWDKWLAKNIT